jgi:3-isopropylmalate dehydrogenase
MEAKIVLLPGDGIGVEVVAVARQILEAVAERYDHKFSFDEHLIGGCAIDACGLPLTDDTLEACRAADAVLLGAVGGPKWDDPDLSVRPEQGLLKLRRALSLFANLRPVKVFPQLADASPVRSERVNGVDILIVRELTGGLYYGQPRLREYVNGHWRAVDTLEYTDEEIRRVVRLAFRLAERRRGLVTSVDKVNVLETSRLWRHVANEVASEFPAVRLEHQLIDAAAMRLIQAAQKFDVLVTSNMFGDILSDEASVLAGSLGMLPSASLGSGSLGVYEPVHGSAPDIAGKNMANPIGAVLSAAMLLRHSLELEAEASAIERAVEAALDSGARTSDIGRAGFLSTRQFGEVIERQLHG